MWVALGLGVAALLAGFIWSQSVSKRKPKPSPVLYDIGELTRRLGVSAEVLEHIEIHYDSFMLKKNAESPYRASNKRLIEAPSTELKQLQRLILRRLLQKLPVHSAVKGFEPGTSVVENALPHVGKKVVIKMDIKDFFSSTTAIRISEYFQRIGWDEECALLLTRVCTYKGRLPQGAPTSPALSNRVNTMMDRMIQQWVDYRKGAYTRYADDITISFPKDYPRRVRGTIQTVGRIAKLFGYEIHRRDKLRILRRHHQQRVTGIVVNDTINIPRKKRRWLRAVEHRMKTTGKCSLTQAELEGWRSYLAMVDAAKAKNATDK